MIQESNEPLENSFFGMTKDRRVKNVLIPYQCGQFLFMLSIKYAFSVSRLFDGSPQLTRRVHFIIARWSTQIYILRANCLKKFYQHQVISTSTHTNVSTPTSTISKILTLSLDKMSPYLRHLLSLSSTSKNWWIVLFQYW